MAEITSGDVVVMVLSDREAAALALLLQDWVDDSYSRGIDCQDNDVIREYNQISTLLHEVFDSFGVRVGD